MNGRGRGVLIRAVGSDFFSKKIKRGVRGWGGGVVRLFGTLEYVNFLIVDSDDNKLCIKIVIIP